MELESIAGGILKKINFGPDSQVKTGSIIAVIRKLSESRAEKDADMPQFIENWLYKEETDGSLTKKLPQNSAISGPEQKHSFKTSFEPINLKQKKELLAKIGAEKAVQMYVKMLEIREFEEAIKLLFLEGKMPGTIHQYIGMEACAVGVCSALEEGDIIASTHRPHGHAIARGLSIKEVMAELYGKSTGCCGGKGGSMHLGNLEEGMLPAIAIVGANIPIIGGMALAFKLRGEKRVAVSFFGDGASNEGAFHEGINMAAVYGIPAVFVCENNLYGASTSIRKTLALENIADRAYGYGMRSEIADGMDVLDVFDKAERAVSFAKEKYLPTLLELKTFRLCGHSRRDPCKYMTEEERIYWQSRDPLVLFEKFLLLEQVVNSESLNKIKNQVKKSIEDAIKYAQESPDPEPEDTYKDLYTDMEVPR